MKDNDNAFPDTDLPVIGWLICIPIGFAVWYIPLYIAETIGFINAIAIIAGIMILLTIVFTLAVQSSNKPDTHKPKHQQTTYTV